jgi:Tfp pilus assembly protein PilV
MKRVGIERGDSLIEVMIALSLTAVTALGLIAVQSTLARGERMALERARAVLIADSVAEGIRGEADRAPVVAQWRVRAAAMLPSGAVDVTDRADGVHIATVSWRAIDEGETCPEPHTACIAVAFAR